MKRIIILLAMGWSLVMTLPANGAVIVNTGVPAGTQNATLTSNPFAAEFSISEDYTITSIWGVFYGNNCNVEICLYQDNA
jgi:hypothetical protein